MTIDRNEAVRQLTAAGAPFEFCDFVVSVDAPDLPSFPGVFSFVFVSVTLTQSVVVIGPWPEACLRSWPPT